MTQDRVMLLIDADNVSLDVIEQAVPWVHKHYGGPHVRRAYCTAESAVKHQAAFKRLSIRPMVNLAAGKNSTDIALAVDAIDLASRDPHEVVVIASSDSDFAPLVSRLREKGCRVVGIGQQGKTGDETVGVYDDYEILLHRKSPASSAKPNAESAAGAATKSAARAPVKKTRTPRNATARKAAVGAAAAPAPPPDKAQAILDVLPELADGKKVELRVAAERLRDAGLLAKSGSSTKLFGQFPDLFELVPDKQPNHVKARVLP